MILFVFGPQLISLLKLLYSDVFKAWGVFRVSRLNNKHYSIAEPILHNPLFKVQLLSSNSVAAKSLQLILI